MTNQGQAVTNPRISAEATNVNGPRLSWGSGCRLDFCSQTEGGELFLLDLMQPYQRRASAAAAYWNSLDLAAVS